MQDGICNPEISEWKALFLLFLLFLQEKEILNKCSKIFWLKREQWVSAFFHGNNIFMTTFCRENLEHFNLE